MAKYVEKAVKLLPYEAPTYIDKKTSAKILDTLVCSFNRSLDKEYGRFPKSNEKDDSPMDLRRHRHVDTHMNFVLSSPLLSYKTQSPAIPRLSKAGPPPKAPARHPLDVFDEAVSKGMMTIPRATGCLMAVRKMLPVNGLRKQVRDMQAGTKVLQWLQSSGAQRSLSFLRGTEDGRNPENQRFLDLLIPFLLVEGREDVIWAWIARLMHGEVDHIPRAGQLVTRLVRARWKTQLPHITVVEAAAKIQSMAADSYGPNASRRTLYYPWKFTSIRSTMQPLQLPTPAAHVFDSFVHLGHLWGRAVDVDMAHLALQHPTNPNPKKAVRYIKRAKTLGHVRKMEELNSYVVRFIQLGIDAINFFIRKEDRAEALRTYEMMALTLHPRNVELMPWNGSAEIARLL